MGVQLELSDELAAALTTEATRLGLSLPEYAVHLLTSTSSHGPVHVRSGAELVSYWRAEGVIGSRADIEDSSGHAVSLRRRAERRDRE